MNEKYLVEKLGQIIRDLRRKQGLSQEDFAHVCGIHRTYVGAIERGEKAMTVITAAKFANSLNLSLSQLFQELEKQL